MVIENLDQILELFEIEKNEDADFKALEKAIEKGLITFNDDNDLCYKVHLEVKSLRNTNAKESDVLRFRRMSAGDRRILIEAGESGAGGAMYKIIGRMCGILSNEYNKLHSQESAVCENIFSLFL